MYPFSKRSGGIFVALLAIASVGLASQRAGAESDEGYILVLDAEGEPQYAADADGRELAFVYDVDGNLTDTIDENGVVIDWEEILAEAALRGE